MASPTTESMPRSSRTGRPSESELAAGNRVSTESRARCGGRAKTVWTRPTVRLPVPRGSRGADSSRRDPIAFSDFGHEWGPDRRGTGTPAARAEGGRRYSITSRMHPRQQIRRVLREPRCTKNSGRAQAKRRDSNLPSPRAYRIPGPYAGQSTSLTRLLHTAVWSVSISLSQVDESPALGEHKRQPRPLNTVKNSPPEPGNSPQI